MNHDAVVVGAGPNGLAAAITIAERGYRVLLIEGGETVGGGCRSGALTLPGFTHDICSAFHAFGVASPFFRGLPLGDYGLSWVDSPAALAHPLDDGSAAVLERSVLTTADALGSDGQAWARLFGASSRHWQVIADQLLDPIRLPRRPLVFAAFGLRGLRSAAALTRRFDGTHAKALFAGMAAHAFLPLDRPLTAGFGLALGLIGHGVGWPFAHGGSQAIADALAQHLRTLGGEIQTGWTVRSLSELPPARAVLLDVTPRQLLAMAGDRLPPRYRRRLERFRYGPGAFKVDYALDGEVPWKADGAERAACLHLGGGFEEIAETEAAIARGQVPERPFTLVGQHSLFDETRAPAGKHTLWAYCHVPSGCDVDMTGRVTAQIERFAPGFRERILATHTYSPAQLEAYNPNYHGGDIAGGSHSGLQMFARPVLKPLPYATPLKGVYLCSASTPPGGGVHGACGNLAARAALRFSLR